MMCRQLCRFADDGMTGVRVHTSRPQSHYVHVDMGASHPFDAPVHAAVHRPTLQEVKLLTAKVGVAGKLFGYIHGVEKR
jgi:hypothetical protein